MSKKPYDLGERDRPTRGLAAHFRAKWMQADQRIRELEEEVARLKEQLERPRICISCQRRAVMTIGKSA